MERGREGERERVARRGAGKLSLVKRQCVFGSHVELSRWGILCIRLIHVRAAEPSSVFYIDVTKTKTERNHMTVYVNKT